MQNYNDNANEEVSLTAEIGGIFNFFEFKMRICSFGKQKQN